jgi:phosphatidate cytidylyltransferase
MSPSIAFHSRIFLLSAAIVVGLLIVAASVLAILRFGAGKEVRPAWLAYAGWLMMIPTIAVAIVLGRTAVIAGIALLSAMGFREFARATGLDRDRWMTGTVYLLVLGTGAVAWADRFAWFSAIPVIAISLLAIVPVLRNRVEGQLRLISLTIFGFLYIGWMFSHIAFLANGPNPYGYLIFLILATEVSDVAAFTFGRLLGHRPLRSQVSPRKTWGGAIGAMAISLALPWAMRFYLPAFSPAELLLTGLLIGIGGQLGDLTISVVKRDLGVKDLGCTIPGHGGILDRMDSLIFVAAPFIHLVRYVHGMG